VPLMHMFANDATLKVVISHVHPPVATQTYW
jgi:hypothetical protein